MHKAKSAFLRAAAALSAKLPSKLLPKSAAVSLAVLTAVTFTGCPSETTLGGSADSALSGASQTVSSSQTSSSEENSSSTVSNESSSATSNSATAQHVSGKLKVHFLDVGQGDSEFIELPNGKTMLIDAGVPDRGSGVVSYIKKLGYSKIDYLVATHPHSDHIGGMTDVVNAFNIGEVYMPRTSSSDTPTTKVYKNLLSAISKKGLKITTAKAGVTMFSSSSLSAVMVAPNGTNYNDLNQYSAVIKLTFGNNKFLFTGDAGNVSEAEIKSDVKADVLKVGHHGSRTSSSAAFLKKVSPKYAVIEVGKGNSYGHPTEQALSRLKAVGAAIYRTDESGTIIFTSDGSKISVNKNASSVKAASTKTSSTSSSQKKSTGSTAAVAAATAPTQSKNNSETVYITKTGKKYHRDGCSSLSKSKISISLSDAKKKDYEPCKKCNPPT